MHNDLTSQTGKALIVLSVLKIHWNPDQYKLKVNMFFDMYRYAE